MLLKILEIQLFQYSKKKKKVSVFNSKNVEDGGGGSNNKFLRPLFSFSP